MDLGAKNDLSTNSKATAKPIITTTAMMIMMIVLLFNIIIFILKGFLRSAPALSAVRSGRNDKSIKLVPCYLLLTFRGHGRLKLFLGRFNFQKLPGVGSDNLVFGIRRFDQNGHVLGAGKKNPLPNVAFQQKVLFAFSEHKRLFNHFNGGRRLL